MRDRKSVMLVMFDLPMKSKGERKAYRELRKFLLSTGYSMVQKSVYAKLLQRDEAMKGEAERVRQVAPSGGDIQLLPMTMAQFKNFHCIHGNGFDMGLFANDVVFCE